MVICLEPGLYFPKSDTSVPEQFRGIGIRIEDDLVITQTGYEVCVYIYKRLHIYDDIEICFFVNLVTYTDDYLYRYIYHDIKI